MSLSHISVTRPVMITMVVMVFVVLGFFSYRRLAIDLFPEVEFPYVTVTTVYPGAGPEEIETQVTEKIEEVVSTLSRVKRIDSISREALSLVVIEFELDTDVDLAAVDVKDEVEAILIDLPKDIEPPVIREFDINAIPIMNLAVSAARPLDEVFQIADNDIKDRLSRVGGVANIDIVGGKEREIHVALDRSRLRAYGLSVMDVVRQVASENVTLPTGHITEENREYTIRVIGEFKDLKELERMKVQVGGNGKGGDSREGEVFLSSLGKVEDAFKEQRELARFNGRSAVGMIIKKRADANTVETAREVKAALTELDEALPEDVRIDIARDRSKFIEESIRDVLMNIFIGIFLTALLLYLFLHDLRATFIAAVAMPTSIVATFLLIDFAGFTINVMSLLALGISIGILVTNAIVVLENIVRFRELGESAHQAAEKGTSEIAVAVVTSTLTNVVVFTPIAFMSGIIGQFFLQFGLTVVFATFFSLFVSFTLTPLLASRILKSSDGQQNTAGRIRLLSGLFAAWDRFYQRVERSYRNGLKWSLDHRGAIIGLSILSFIVAIYLFRYVGGEFIPSGDQGMISVLVEMPPGTPLRKPDEALGEIEAVINEIPEVRSVMVTIGGENRGVEDGELILNLADLDERSRGIVEIMNDLRPRLAGIPAADITVQQYSGFGDESDVVIEITGEDFGRLREIADQVAEMARETNGLVDVRTSWKGGKPEMVFRPDRKNLADYGLNVSSVAGELRACFEGVKASLYRERSEEYDIRVQVREEDRSRVGDLKRVAIFSDGNAIPIDQLGKVTYAAGQAEILRKDKQRLVDVYANVATGSLMEHVATMREKTAQIGLPQGYRIYFGGQVERREESFAQIIQALLLATILTYMILAAILESYIHPFTIMLPLPLGLIGASLALFFSGKTINLFSMMALVMLVGIVVNNAILILDYTAVLRKRGIGIIEALLEAAPIRLRPIVIANLAIAVGILPQTMSGSGSEFRVAMAVVTMGGVLISAVFTLFLIPVIYTYFDRFAKVKR